MIDDTIVVLVIEQLCCESDPFDFRFFFRSQPTLIGELLYCNGQTCLDGTKLHTYFFASISVKGVDTPSNNKFRQEIIINEMDLDKKK